MMQGKTLMTVLLVVMKTSNFWIPGRAESSKILENLETCNVTSEGKEFVCRGVGFQSVKEVLRIIELRTSVVNLTKM